VRCAIGSCLQTGHGLSNNSNTPFCLEACSPGAWRDLLSEVMPAGGGVSVLAPYPLTWDQPWPAEPPNDFPGGADDGLDGSSHTHSLNAATSTIPGRRTTPANYAKAISKPFTRGPAPGEIAAAVQPHN